MAQLQTDTGHEESTATILRGIHYQYPGQATASLKNVTLSIPQGSCFGLLGHNGAGKTTLLSLLSGTRSLQKGKLSFPATADAARPRISLVPQDYAFYAELSGQQNLEFFARLQGIKGALAAERLQWVTEFCALAEVLAQAVATYSGGLKRRLNLAIGLLNQPHYLFLDEPTVGIDSRSRRDILTSIARLKDQGMTIIYTSHYLEEVESLCDHVSVLHQGEVVLSGELSELLALERKVVLQLASPVATHPLEQLSAQLDECHIEANEESNQLQVSLNDVPISRLLEAVEALPAEIASIQTRDGLEELYLRLTDDSSSAADI